MTDLELIEKHMVERFKTPDPFVQKRIRFLENEIDRLNHRVMCLELENRGLYAKQELHREEREGDRAQPGSLFALTEQSARTP